VRIVPTFTAAPANEPKTGALKLSGIANVPLGPLLILVKPTVGRFRPIALFKLKNRQHALLGYGADFVFCAAVPKDESGVFLVGPRDDGKKDSAEKFKDECIRIAASW
jgi:hypothetical protein